MTNRHKLRRAFLDEVLLGNMAAVKDALQRGVHVDVRDPEHGETALMLAVQFGHSRVICLLLHQGADVNARDRRGFTPLMLAKADALSELLRRGAQIDAQDASGQTALMHAVLQADYDKVKLLIDHGADISLCDDNGETALAHAMSYGLLGIQEWLMAQSS